jgi:hypothetical protein
MANPFNSQTILPAILLIPHAALDAKLRPTAQQTATTLLVQTNHRTSHIQKMMRRKNGLAVALDDVVSVAINGVKTTAIETIPIESRVLIAAPTRQRSCRPGLTVKGGECRTIVVSTAMARKIRFPRRSRIC